MAKKTPPTDPVMIALADRLRESRVRQGVTIYAIAAVIDVSPSTLSCWERRKTKVDPTKLRGWAKLLHEPLSREERERAEATYRARWSVAECGTPAGYARHRREGTPICEPCRQVNRDRNKNYRIKAKADGGN